jgi:hypothetical protein
MTSTGAAREGRCLASEPGERETVAVTDLTGALPAVADQ